MRRSQAAASFRNNHISVPERNHWISPAGILDLVRNTAPFLLGGDGAFALGPRREYLARLRKLDERALSADDSLPALEYFQLCVAAHWATAGTFVPTDVDSKIRGILWRECRDKQTLRAMCDYAVNASEWDLTLVSRRITAVPEFGEISGHNGEWLSVVAAAHGRFGAAGDPEYFEMTGDAIHAELEREAVGFRSVLHTPGAELDTLRLAASVTHNCGDLDQAVSFWNHSEANMASRTRFHRLAHENRTPYGGTFQVAARLYREALASEGHRNYPLRAVRILRTNPDFLLPLGPFLDDWGGMIAKHPLLDGGDRSEILGALVSGCRKIPGQQGYFRALAGFEQTSSRAFQDAAGGLSTALARDLKEFRPKISIPLVTFESPLRKLVSRARAWHI